MIKTAQKGKILFRNLKPVVLIVTVFSLGILGCSQPNTETEGDTENKGNTSVTVESTQEKSNPLENKGIGPIKNIQLGEINNEMVEAGKLIYEKNCIACHNIDVKLVGPPQAGVLERRSPEWIMNLILNPTEMLEKDPIAKALLKEYNNVPMTDQQLSEEDARNILEYFRTI